MYSIIYVSPFGAAGIVILTFWHVAALFGQILLVSVSTFVCAVLEKPDVNSVVFTAFGLPSVFFSNFALYTFKSANVKSFEK